jgi:hypothetical protein
MATVKSKIDELVAFGGTNQPIGLSWAWWTLRDSAPYNDAYAREDDNTDYLTAIVLFTDGVNTRNFKYGNGSSQSSQIDDRQRLLCTAIKADYRPKGKKPIQIYTVQVDTDGSGKQQVLKDCASKPEYYYFMTTPSQITSAFEDIAASLSKLRIAQ